MEVTLTILDHYASASRQVVMRLPATVGRGPGADIPIEDPWMSRFHCLLNEHEGRVTIRDLGARNGTFVNGQRVSEGVLCDGDRLTLGLTKVSVQFERPLEGAGGFAAAITPAAAPLSAAVPAAAEETTRPMPPDADAGPAVGPSHVAGAAPQPGRRTCSAAAT